ncbi:neutral zinc metallopeptidase [Frigidibacter sp. RF13]|uniref:KPN_02809 family neutral zinc metallopeptidase n=1 Tax=Frigidibacter sp. RF13 TaxID=2997340 RepID=UPI00226E9E17|nr:neutral zinc metallopeptidase [Frigidibacter sp. RF13]MCY1125414.1 neutral zinc metallopeptidase [Frigidibacter sp. RF13]
MKWQGRRGSANIEDRRRMSAGGAIGGGGLGLVVVALLVWALGGDPIAVLQQGMGAQQIGGTGGGEVTEADERAAQFVSVTLVDTEAIWSQIFEQELGRAYQPVTLVLFKGGTQSGCGGASSMTGPFYCPLDKKVYLDTDFFATLSQRLGAKGDFAAAYVVAHEIGHAVQDQLGILEKTTQIRKQSSEADSNAISVRVELQADCFSGVWARYAAEQLGTLEQGDIQEAVNAAAQIGDDTLQRNAGQRPMPDSFTHGSSEQRQQWLATGYQQGTIRACDTFSASAP